MSDKQKQLNGKHKFWNRVDIPDMTEPVAELRKVIIEDIGKYPESMEWPDIPVEDFIDAIQRHLDDVREAGDPFAVDPESGLPHLYAVGFNYMVWSMKHRNSEMEIMSSDKKMDILRHIQELHRKTESYIGDTVDMNNKSQMNEAHNIVAIIEAIKGMIG